MNVSSFTPYAKSSGFELNFTLHIHLCTDFDKIATNVDIMETVFYDIQYELKCQIRSPFYQKICFFFKIV